MNQSARKFLEQTPPFSFLPAPELAEVAQKLQRTEYPAGTLLCVQGQQRLQNVFIVAAGSVELFSEAHGEKTLRGVAGPGEVLGGIALLVSEGQALRTLRVREPSQIYLLPADDFLQLCRCHADFAGFFTERLGRNLLDKSYLALVARIAAPPREVIPPPYFHESVASFAAGEVPTIPEHAGIQEAAQRMNQLGQTCLLVLDATGRVAGIVTDQDFRAKVAAAGWDISRPVRDIMSAPLITISREDSALDAILRMAQHDIKHLGLTDGQGKVVGVITHNRLLQAQGHSPVALVGRISAAREPAALRNIQPEIAPIVKHLLAGGARPDQLTGLITAIAAAVLRKLLDLALTEAGPPPLRFAFMLLGSEGRREQTLLTDQDNAILYEDPPPGQAAEVQRYFLQLGERVCGWLNDAGYRYCRGNVMAQNPRWCQPLARWKEDFRGWIRTPEPRAVMHATIFFDFSAGYGAESLIAELRASLFEMLATRADTFFYHLAGNALQTRPPLGFFRHFVVESAGEHRNELDIKKAMTPLVDLARAYALQHRIAATNTLERFAALRQLGVLREEEYRELTQSFRYLMQIRLSHQVQKMTDEKAPPTNFLNPALLSRIEQKLLKEIFGLLREYQEKMRVHFQGIM